MAVDYEETELLFPRPAFIALAGTLIATDVFILLTIFWNLGTNWAEFIFATILFAAVIFGCAVARIRIRIADGQLTIRQTRKLTIQLSEIRDWRTGDIDIIKNYAGYGFKKAKYKTYVCAGIDTAFSLKAGRYVVTATSRHVEDIVKFFPAPATKTAAPAEA